LKSLRVDRRRLNRALTPPHHSERFGYMSLMRERQPKRFWCRYGGLSVGAIGGVLGVVFALLIHLPLLTLPDGVYALLMLTQVALSACVLLVLAVAHKNYGGWGYWGCGDITILLGACGLLLGVGLFAGAAAMVAGGILIRESN